MKKRIYIGGRVTKDIAENGYLACYNKFEVFEKSLQEKYPAAIIYNPMKLCKSDWSWLRCMVVCIYTLVLHCNTLILMNDYTESRGANIELWIAKKLKKDIQYVN